METQKVINLLNGSDKEYAKFATKKWYVIDSELKGNYSNPDPINFLTKSLESSLCDCPGAYILVTGNIAVTELLLLPLVLLLVLNLEENNHLLQIHEQYLKIVHHLNNILQ